MFSCVSSAQSADSAQFNNQLNSKLSDLKNPSASSLQNFKGSLANFLGGPSLGKKLNLFSTATIVQERGVISNVGSYGDPVRHGLISSAYFVHNSVCKMTSSVETPASTVLELGDRYAVTQAAFLANSFYIVLESPFSQTNLTIACDIHEDISLSLLETDLEGVLKFEP